MAVDVLQEPAVAPGTLGEQDAGGKGRGWMKLHRLHVAERGDAGLQGDGGWNTFGDNRLGGDAVKTPRPAAGNCSSLGDVSCQLSSNETSNYRPVAARAIVDQGDRFRALMHRNLVGNRLITHGSEHGMAGAVGDITGAPLVGAAEGALGDQAVGFIALGDGDFLTVDDDLAIA